MGWAVLPSSEACPSAAACVAFSAAACSQNLPAFKREYSRRKGKKEKFIQPGNAHEGTPVPALYL